MTCSIISLDLPSRDSLACTWCTEAAVVQTSVMPSVDPSRPFLVYDGVDDLSRYPTDACPSQPHAYQSLQLLLLVFFLRRAGILYRVPHMMRSREMRRGSPVWALGVARGKRGTRMTNRWRCLASMLV